MNGIKLPNSINQRTSIDNKVKIRILILFLVSNIFTLLLSNACQTTNENQPISQSPAIHKDMIQLSIPSNSYVANVDNHPYPVWIYSSDKKLISTNSFLLNVNNVKSENNSVADISTDTSVSTVEIDPRDLEKIIQCKNTPFFIVPSGINPPTVRVSIPKDNEYEISI